jgi:hypothetical protein
MILLHLISEEFMVSTGYGVYTRLDIMFYHLTFCLLEYLDDSVLLGRNSSD